MKLDFRTIIQGAIAGVIGIAIWEVALKPLLVPNKEA